MHPGEQGREVVMIESELVTREHVLFRHILPHWYDLETCVTLQTTHRRGNTLSL